MINLKFIISYRFLATFSLIVLISILSLFSSCELKQSRNLEASVLFKDMYDREVLIPKNPQRIIAHGAGALRFICYLQATEKVVAIEESERRRNAPYIMAHPELRKLSVIGSGNHADAELISSIRPDLIICTYKSKQEVEVLQEKTATPVICLNYGDFNQQKEIFYNSLAQLGKILAKEKRADTLIQFIKGSVDFIQSKNKFQHYGKHYIGGIAYRGAHGINSTEPQYAPFEICSVPNVSQQIFKETKNALSKLSTIIIDKEQIIEWNPDKIFIDLSGYPFSKPDLVKQSNLGQLLKAVQEEELYLLLPHIWNSINYENILINSYYIASLFQPKEFNSPIEEKADEIYQQFLGAKLYAEMQDLYGYGCQKVKVHE